MQTRRRTSILVCADLIGLRHGNETPIPWRSVHRTATLRNGARSTRSFFHWQAQRGVTRAPNRPLQPPFHIRNFPRPVLISASSIDSQACFRISYGDCLLFVPRWSDSRLRCIVVAPPVAIPLAVKLHRSRSSISWNFANDYEGVTSDG